MEASNTRQKVRRSEKMTPEEKKAYAKLVSTFETKTDAAEFFGFSTVTLDAVLLKGSGKPGTVAIIREKLGTAA